MKKRLFSLLLSLCLVAGLFAGMTATAYADGDTQTYTVPLGDTLGGICNKLGVDYNANKEWILKTNNIKNQNIISVGHVLTLPAKGKVLTWVDTSSTATTGTTTGTTVATTTTNNYGVPTITYTLKSGDFVSTVCQRLGIDFAANDAWIRAANNITNYNNLKVGRVLTLPAPGTTPALNTAGASATTSSAVAAVSTIATTTGSVSAVNLLAGDTISYYLTNYTVRSGDTLYNICRNYGANMDTVQKMNGIADASKLRVGQVLSIPTATASAGSVAVVAHKVVSGDTVQGICNQYGVNYGANATKIKGLNNRDNLDAIKVGQTILIPVAGISGGGGSVVPGGGGSVTPGTSGSAFYTLNKTGAQNGTYALTVNGQSVNGAAAGQTVHIVTTPDHLYKVGSVKVVRDYNGVAVQVDANYNFVMPACDVRIEVSFVANPSAAPHAIQPSGATQTSNMTFVVNGYTNNTAEPGRTVTIVLGTLQSGLTIDKVYVTTTQVTADQIKNGTLDAKYYLPVSNMSFVMPACDVYVTVFLKGA